MEELTWKAGVEMPPHAWAETGGRGDGEIQRGLIGSSRGLGK